jgi:hypothetical protein
MLRINYSQTYTKLRDLRYNKTMNPFPYSSFVYSFAAITSFLYGVKSWLTYKQTGNLYSKMFSRLGLVVSIAFILWGLPLLFYPKNHRLAGMAYVLATIPYFIALNEPVKVALNAWEKYTLQKIAAFGVPIYAIIFSLLHLQNLPKAYVDDFGIINWDVPFPFNLITVISGIIVAIIPAWFLFFAKTTSRKAAIKKNLFSLTFSFASIAGWFLIILSGHPIVLIILFTFFLIGFISLALLMLIDVFMKESDTAKEVFSD